MHHDKKVGLGILLVGIVGAIFFREEPRALDPLPEFRSAEMLDREISESLVDQPKPSTDLEEYEQLHRPTVDLQGIETAGVDEEKSGVPATGKKVFDEEFDFLNEPAEAISDSLEVAQNSGESGPAEHHEEPALPVAEKNKPARDMTVSESSPSRELSNETGMFTANLSASQESVTQPFVEDLQHDTSEDTQDSANSSATDTTPTEPELRTYVVQEGDTLSGISSRFLGRQALFGKLFELNRDQLASPDDLRPGMRLEIPAAEQLNQPTEISLSEFKDSSSTHSPQPELERLNSQAPQRDRRVIVPRRVRLNEPIARNPNRSDEPRATFTDLAPEEESIDGLPTLEGLEPLELPR